MSFPYTIGEVEEILTEIADTIPDEFFKHLNGGVLLLEEYKNHDPSLSDKNLPPETFKDLWTLGTYNYNVLGRSIHIYYGSFAKVYENASKQQIRNQLEETLLHEFTHHLESLAGERGLEIKDKIFMDNYLKKKRKELHPDC